ncbi:hypothetical protein [Rhizobium gallicum]|uniref:hypothetical protein n=1 Tax=Rhizobium gallicum TaxID=56730 RepID=UPI001EF9A720|nr:hypothetical protein [Rhizobium gallicum]ULJ74410.1 hypothetical protein L2W42_21255 [Rhizobium gallicum]
MTMTAGFATRSLRARCIERFGSCGYSVCALGFTCNTVPVDLFAPDSLLPGEQESPFLLPLDETQAIDRFLGEGEMLRIISIGSADSQQFADAIHVLGILEVHPWQIDERMTDKCWEPLLDPPFIAMVTNLDAITRDKDFETLVAQVALDDAVTEKPLIAFG